MFYAKINDFMAYQLAQAQRQAAYERYNYAGVALENAQIKERLAEIQSQAEPMDGLIDGVMSERDRLYAIAFYVVIGRLPKPGPAPGEKEKP